MPRPRTVSDEAILDAVRDLAHRIGPARLTFAAVAAEVGLSAATLVQRFGSRRDLLLAADKRGVDLWGDALDRATAASPLAHVVEGLVLAVEGVAHRSGWRTRSRCSSSTSPIPISTPRRSAEHERSAPTSSVT
jgi:AcrR family transcriptional regulator